MTLDLDAVAHRIYWWQDRLGMADWRLTIEAGELDNDAECNPDADYLQAVITVNLDQLDPDDLDETAVHELMHALVSPYTSAAGYLAGEKNRAAQEWLRVAEEQMVTRLARILSLALRPQ